MVWGIGHTGKGGGDYFSSLHLPFFKQEQPAVLRSETPRFTLPNITKPFQPFIQQVNWTKKGEPTTTEHPWPDLKFSTGTTWGLDQGTRPEIKGIKADSVNTVEEFLEKIKGLPDGPEKKGLIRQVANYYQGLIAYYNQLVKAGDHFNPDDIKFESPAILKIGSSDEGLAADFNKVTLQYTNSFDKLVTAADTYTIDGVTEGTWSERVEELQPYLATLNKLLTDSGLFSGLTAVPALPAVSPKTITDLNNIFTIVAFTADTYTYDAKLDLSSLGKQKIMEIMTLIQANLRYLGSSSIKGNDKTVKLGGRDLKLGKARILYLYQQLKPIYEKIAGITTSGASDKAGADNTYGKGDF
jgi:hypothetical protein